MKRFEVRVAVRDVVGTQTFAFYANNAADALLMAKAGLYPDGGEFIEQELEVQDLDWDGVTAAEIDEVDD